MNGIKEIFSKFSSKRIAQLSKKYSFYFLVLYYIDNISRNPSPCLLFSESSVLMEAFLKTKYRTSSAIRLN